MWKPCSHSHTYTHPEQSSWTSASPNHVWHPFLWIFDSWHPARIWECRLGAFSAQPRLYSQRSSMWKCSLCPLWVPGLWFQATTTAGWRSETLLQHAALPPSDSNTKHHWIIALPLGSAFSTLSRFSSNRFLKLQTAYHVEYTSNTSGNPFFIFTVTTSIGVISPNNKNMFLVTQFPWKTTLVLAVFFFFSPLLNQYVDRTFFFPGRPSFSKWRIRKKNAK